MWWCRGEIEVNPGGGDVGGQVVLGTLCCCCVVVCCCNVDATDPWIPRLEGIPVPDTRLYGSNVFHCAGPIVPSPFCNSIAFNQWGGESDRESVSCPEDTIAGSMAVKSGAAELFQPVN